ncbi:MAG: tyrosine-type recombinase/integrase [Cellulosilyticaceae bacterium]
MASISKYYRKDKDGTKKQYGWRGQIELPTGKRKTVYGKTKANVQSKIDLINNDLLNYGTTLSTSKYTVSEWTHTHLFTNKIHKLSASTFELYIGVYKNYIAPSSLGEMQVSDVTHLHIQEFLNSHNHLSHTSLKKFYLVLLSAFNSAIKNNLIRINPAKGVIIPNKEKERSDIEILTKDQQRDYILATKGEKHELLFLTALFTGLRQGELIALRWENVDLEHGIIRVCESIKRSRVYTSDGKSTMQAITKPPKSKAGNREVPIPQFLLEKLIAHKPSEDSDQLNKKYVFETSSGNSLYSRNISTYHLRVCKRAKINPIYADHQGTDLMDYKGIKFHALRHTYATRLLEAGENIKTVQVLLGHADIETTLNVYAHVLEDTKRASAEKQQSIFDSLISNSF